MIVQSSIMPWPSEDVSKSEKLSGEYGLAVSKSIWSRFSLNLTMYGYSNVAWFQSMTNYAQGRQPSAPYMDWFMVPASDKTGGTDRDVVSQNWKRKGYTDIDYTVRSLAGKYAGVTKSILTSTDHKVKVFSKNPESVKEKAMRKGELYVNATITNKWRKKLGVREKKMDWQPTDRQQLDLYDKMNGFALPIESGMEALINHGFDIGDWKTARLAYADRAIEHGVMVGKVCYNTDGAVTFQYIHPAMYICEEQSTDIQSEPSFAGHVEKRKIKDLKPQLLELGYTQDQIRELAIKYKTWQPAMYNANNFNFNYRDPVTQAYIWEDFVIDVLCFQWITVDTDTYVKRENKAGNMEFFKSDSPDEYKDGDYKDGRKRKKVKKKDQTVYAGEWIIGENKMIEWGKHTNIIWPTDHRCATDYVVVRVPGQSIAERWKPYCDDYMKANIKTQAAVNEAKGKGLIVDFGILSNMDIGWGEMEPLEVVAIAKQTGIQLINSAAKIIERVDPTKAIRETEGGAGILLGEMLTLQREYAFNMQAIAGITDALAAAPSEGDDKLKFVTEMEVTATNHALWPYKDGLIRFKEKLGAKMAAKGMSGVKFDPRTRKYYNGVIGKDKTDALFKYSEYSLNQLWIQMVVILSDQMKREVYEQLKTATTPGRNGEPAISAEEALAVMKFLEEDNLELAQLYLADAIKRHAQEAQAIQQQAQQANEQSQLSSITVAETEKRKSLAYEYQLKMAYDKVVQQYELRKQSQDNAEKTQGAVVEIREKSIATQAEIKLEGLIEATLGAVNDQDVGNKV